MIRGALAGGQQIFQHEAILYCTQPISQTAYVAGFDFTNQGIDDLLLRFDPGGLLSDKVFIAESNTGRVDVPTPQPTANVS